MRGCISALLSSGIYRPSGPTGVVVALAVRNKGGPETRAIPLKAPRSQGDWLAFVQKTQGSWRQGRCAREADLDYLGGVNAGDLGALVGKWVDYCRFDYPLE